MGGKIIGRVSRHIERERGCFFFFFHAVFCASRFACMIFTSIVSADRKMIVCHAWRANRPNRDMWSRCVSRSQPCVRFFCMAKHRPFPVLGEKTTARDPLVTRTILTGYRAEIDYTRAIPEIRILSARKNIIIKNRTRTVATYNARVILRQRVSEKTFYLLFSTPPSTHSLAPFFLALSLSRSTNRKRRPPVSLHTSRTRSHVVARVLLHVTRRRRQRRGDLKRQNKRCVMTRVIHSDIANACKRDRRLGLTRCIIKRFHVLRQWIIPPRLRPDGANDAENSRRAESTGFRDRDCATASRDMSPSYRSARTARQIGKLFRPLENKPIDSRINRNFVRLPFVFRVEKSREPFVDKPLWRRQECACH